MTVPTTGASTSISPRNAKRIEAFFKKVDSETTGLIFAIDATASRQQTWDMAAKIMSELFRVAADGPEVQLIFYRGESECVASRWLPNAGALSAVTSRVMCRAGPTQIGRVLAHVEKEDQRRKVAAVVFVGDAVEEPPSELYTAARRLRDVPIFMLQEGDDRAVAGVYSEVASITKGASCRFDAGAAARLADLLKAVVAFATGGRQALANQKTEAARLLLSQMK
jgi:hypothetical protein